eukprot:g316.t1
MSLQCQCLHTRGNLLLLLLFRLELELELSCTRTPPELRLLKHVRMISFFNRWPPPRGRRCRHPDRACTYCSSWFSSIGSCSSTRTSAASHSHIDTAGSCQQSVSVPVLDLDLDLVRRCYYFVPCSRELWQRVAHFLYIGIAIARQKCLSVFGNRSALEQFLLVLVRESRVSSERRPLKIDVPPIEVVLLQILSIGSIYSIRPTAVSCTMLKRKIGVLGNVAVHEMMMLALRLPALGAYYVRCALQKLVRVRVEIISAKYLPRPLVQVELLRHLS